MYSCARGQHLHMCGRACGWQRKYMEINASSCSLYTSNAALLLAPQRSGRPRARGSKANEKAIAQTHPADPWILIPLRREREGGRVSSLAQQHPEKCFFFLKKKKTKQEEGGGASGGSKCTSEMLWGLNHARIGGRLLKRLMTNLP